MLAFQGTRRAVALAMSRSCTTAQALSAAVRLTGYHATIGDRIRGRSKSATEVVRGRGLDAISFSCPGWRLRFCGVVLHEDFAFRQTMGECKKAVDRRNKPTTRPLVRSSEGVQETDMDWQRFEGNWKQLKGNVKAQWGDLTDDDLAVINGKREILEGKLQERYGYTKDQVRQQLDDWFKTLK
jgi:uncharacterized protein YjbJ (UPF0337 family)